MTTEELRSQVEALRSEIRELGTKEDITPEEDARLDEAIDELDVAEPALAKSEARDKRVAQVEDAVRNDRVRTDFTPPNIVIRTDADELFDVRTLRTDSNEELRSRAMRTVEDNWPTDIPDNAREDAVKLLSKTRRSDADLIARHIIRTSRPEYVEAFEEYCADPTFYRSPVLGQREARTAMSLTAANGGVMVPPFLDPTIILTNTGIQNPIRQIASQVSITSNVWEGVTSGGATAEWLGEGSEAADGSPSFVGPTITPAKEAAWIFGSYELLADADWNETGMLIADAFDRLEGAGFVTGTGSGQPYGLVTRLSGAGPVVAGTSTGGANSAQFTAADAYAVDSALGARWRQDASWLTSPYFANVVRATTDTQYNFWATFGGGLPPEMIGYPVYIHSTMGTYPVLGAVGATTITSGSADYPIILGDFDQYQIVDRIGVTVLYEPMVKSTGNGRPTGQAGWFSYKRVGADVLTSTAFKTLKL